MRIVIIVVAATLLMFVTLPARAEWSKQYSVDYIMGDGDNRASARQAAVEQIKLKASGEAGTYIQGTTTLHENGELTENIQMLSASMVKVLASEEKLTVNSAGQAVLQVKAIASLDGSELVRRVEAIQQDKAKERQVKQLRSENEVLRKDFEKIRKELATKLDQAKIAELLARQDATLKRMADNGQTMTQVFERGTLIQLASRNMDDFENAKRDLDENFYAPLMQSPFTATIESVEADGNGYVAVVRVGWRVDTQHARQVLARYLNVGRDNDKNSITITTYDNLTGRGPNVLSERVYRYLVTKEVNLKLEIDGTTSVLPVFFVDKSFFQDCGVRISIAAMHGGDKNLCLVSQQASDAKLLGFWNTTTSNPIRIPLSRSQAELATRVDVSIQFKTPDTRTVGRQ